MSAEPITGTLPDYDVVLLPVDGSPGAERALEPARWLAANFGAELHLVTSGVSPTTAWYRRYIDPFAAELPGVALHTVAATEAATAVASVARELQPSLVCLSTHGWSRGASVLGSTFVGVARALGEPLVAVGPRATLPVTERHGRIVACLDGTSRSEAVLPLTAAWAERLGLRMSLLLVAEPTPSPIVPAGHLSRRQHLDDPEAYLAEVAGRDVEGVVAWDPLGPRHGLVEQLEDNPATLVALTSRVRRDGARLLHGSEAARLIRCSPAPVLLLPTVSSPTTR